MAHANTVTSFIAIRLSVVIAATIQKTRSADADVVNMPRIQQSTGTILRVLDLASSKIKWQGVFGDAKPLRSGTDHHWTKFPLQDVVGSSDSHH
jgi:hypothetical protein